MKAAIILARSSACLAAGLELPKILNNRKRVACEKDIAFSSKSAFLRRKQ
jgi:hypothetical protein